jgi:hypothetical protein
LANTPLAFDLIVGFFSFTIQEGLVKESFLRLRLLQEASVSSFEIVL